MTGGSRKYLPAEGYRFLILQFLQGRGDRGASKGQIAWETRANHYMATRVLSELAASGWVEVDGNPSDGFVIRISVQGIRLLTQQRAYWHHTFQAMLKAHFRYGKRPAWLAAQP